MAFGKLTVASGTYIVNTGTTTVTYQAPGVRANVNSTVLPVTYTTANVLIPTGAGLVPPIQVVAPGVFTEGTPKEGTTSKPTNDSNG